MSNSLSSMTNRKSPSNRMMLPRIGSWKTLPIIMTNTHRAETNWPFASPLEIPLIEQDSMEPVAYWPEHHEGFVMEENEDNESEEDIVNQICESTWISNAGAINQMSEENYGHCWTGM